jgi:hypothetical protein
VIIIIRNKNQFLEMIRKLNLFKSDFLVKTRCISRYFTSNIREIDFNKENQILSIFCEFEVLTKEITKKKAFLKCFALGIHVDNFNKAHDLSIIQEETFGHTNLNYRSYIAIIGACYCIDKASKIIASDRERYKQIIVHIPSKELIAYYKNKFLLTNDRSDDMYETLLGNLSGLLRKIGSSEVIFKHFDEVRQNKSEQIKIAKQMASKALKAYKMNLNVRESEHIK